MVAFLRQFLVVLLVVLQGILPLVHAHTGPESLQKGLHIHGFEAFNATISDCAFQAVDQDLAADEAIVYVESAIKQSVDNYSGLGFYIPVALVSFSFPQHTPLLSFSPQALDLILVSLIEPHGSRAPPGLFSI